MVEAFPWDPPPQYLLRDRDKIFGAIFRQRVHSLDMSEVLIATFQIQLPGKYPARPPLHWH